VAWRADAETQRRLDELGDRSNEGALTAAERDECETYVQAIEFVAILQAKARGVLARNAADRGRSGSPDGAGASWREVRILPHFRSRLTVGAASD
jgi:hypothetical protein